MKIKVEWTETVSYTQIVDSEDVETWMDQDPDLVEGDNVLSCALWCLLESPVKTGEEARAEESVINPVSAEYLR